MWTELICLESHTGSEIPGPRPGWTHQVWKERVSGMNTQIPGGMGLRLSDIGRHRFWVEVVSDMGRYSR